MPDGSVQQVKVYFKAPPLTKFTAEVITHMMAQSAGETSSAVAVVIDARRRRLWTPSKKPSREIDVLLTSEAVGYASMWKALSA